MLTKDLNAEKEIKERLNQLTMENGFIPLSFDKFFKALMKNNVDIFRELLVSILGLKNNISKSYIMFMDNEFACEHIKEHGKRIDINVKFGNNLMIDVEINTEEYSTVRGRNDLYLEKLDISNYKESDSYADIKNKRIYQINLNANSKESQRKGKSVVVEYDIINNKIFDNRKKKYNYNLVYYYKKWYNNGKKMTYSEYLMAALYSKSYTEIYDILSNILSKDRLNEFMRGVINMLEEGFILHEWDREYFDKMVEKNVEELAKKRGLREGRREGKKIGREEGRREGKKIGREEGKISMIKKLLIQKIDYIVISNASGKTIDEIKEIEASMEK